MDYASLYPVVACQARGRIGKWWIHKQYKSFRVITKYYYPANPQTQAQQANRALMSNAVQYWQGFTDEAKQFYNSKLLPTHMTGYNRYIGMYLRATEPPIPEDEYLLQETGDKILQEIGDGILLE